MLSVTLTEYCARELIAVGLPLIAPVLASIDNPAGNAAYGDVVSTAYVKGGDPPVVSTGVNVSVMPFVMILSVGVVDCFTAIGEE